MISLTFLRFDDFVRVCTPACEEEEVSGDVDVGVYAARICETRLRDFVGVTMSPSLDSYRSGDGVAAAAVGKCVAWAELPLLLLSLALRAAETFAAAHALSESLGVAAARISAATDFWESTVPVSEEARPSSDAHGNAMSQACCQ